MPRENPDIYEDVAYITDAGDEIIISRKEEDRYWETIGRAGFHAPDVKVNAVEMADGTTVTQEIVFEPRTVTLKIVITGVTRQEAAALYNDIATRLIQVGTREKWGRLRLRRADGSYVFLDCVYAGGLNIAEKYPRIFQAELEFFAADPYFYDGYDSRIVLRSFGEGAYLHFGWSTHFGAQTFFRSADILHTENVLMNGHRAYPVITITGPARSILLHNKTTGAVLQFDMDFCLLSGESVEIHTRPSERSAVWRRLDGSSRNALRYLTASSTLNWFLTAGNNVILFRNSDFNAISTCTLIWQQGWISAL